MLQMGNLERNNICNVFNEAIFKTICLFLKGNRTPCEGFIQLKLQLTRMRK